MLRYRVCTIGIAVNVGGVTLLAGDFMKLYFAGGETQDYAIILDIAGVKRRLLSFFYVPKFLKEKKHKLAEYYGTDKDLFIDSGAYSAFTQEAEINIMDYIDFLQFHQPETYANLDDINSWEKTLKNQKLMEEAGLKPIPVWHAKEPFNVLKDYIGSYNIVGIGFATLAASQDRKHLAKTLITEFPKQNFHLFALTHLGVLAEYNFYSADSTGWVLRASKFATIDTPFGYIGFSQRYEGGMSTQGIGGTTGCKFVGDLDEKDKTLLTTYLQTFGFSIYNLSTEYKRSWILRVFYQAKFFLLYEEACNSIRREGKPVTTRMLDAFLRQKIGGWKTHA